MPDSPAAPGTFLPTYDGCFVCGQTHQTGLCTRFYAGEEGKVHGEFKPNQSQTGFVNIVHGGIITAFLDELMGWPIALANNQICSTGELTIRFRRPVFAGQTYLGTSVPGVQFKGRAWDGKGQLADQAGNIVAEGTGRYFLVPDAQTHAFAAVMRFQPGDHPSFRAPEPK